MRSTRRSRAAFALLAIAVPGCNEHGDDPAGSSGGVRADAGLTTIEIPPTPCVRKPEENSPCYRASVVCEVGTSPDPTCNSLFVCATDPAYGMYWTEQRRGSCARCPDASAIVDGAPCELGDAGAPAGGELACATAQGTCACTIGPDGAHAHPRRWVCVVPADGCPPERPKLGQPCVGEHTCDYGACAFARGASMTCESGVWEIEAASCP